MPIPKPSKGESRESFISRCNSAMAKEFPDAKQRNAVCFDAWRNSKKESMFSNIWGMEKKGDTENIQIGGYLATTHLDSGFFDEDREIYIKDQIAIETLEEWAKQLNDGNPRVNKASVHHNREPHVTGMAIKDSAKVEELPDGHFGLYVDTLIDRTKGNFESTKSRLDEGFLDSFSIEFSTRDPLTSEYLEGAITEEAVGNGVIRTLLPGTQLEGYTLASQPMNEAAIRIKEIFEFKEKLKKEVNKMTEKTESKEGENKGVHIDDSKADENRKKTEEIRKKRIEMMSAKKEVPELTDEMKQLIRKGLEAEEKEQVEAKEAERKEIVNKIKEDLKMSLGKANVEEKVQVNKDVNLETKEYVEYKEIFNRERNMSIDDQFKVAGRFAESKGIIGHQFPRGFKPMDRPSMARKHFSITNITEKGFHNGAILECKNLGLTTNQNTDVNYLLSSAELADVFDPVIFNALSQPTVTWNILPKEDFSNKGNDQVQFTNKVVINASVGPYAGNAISTGNVGRLKFQTRFKKYAAGVAVDGDMIAAARGGPIGDVFAQEVADSTVDLLQRMNQDLFKDIGLETAVGIIGFEFITNNAANTTLYNLPRDSTTNLLSPNANGDTRINGNNNNLSIENLRAAKRQALKEGAMIQNLFYVGDHIQGDKLRGIYDAAHRMTPTTARFGFDQMMTFDTIPFFEDKDCNDDDVFLVDMETHRIAIWVPPTLEMLGKDSDADKGFIKTYFATFNRQVRRMVQIRNNKTT